MKVLVTGAKGFIGQHVSDFFSKQGHVVIECDRQFDFKKSNNKSVIIDLTDIEQVRRILKEEKPEVIIHCAGLADVNESLKEPYLDYESNVTVTHNLLFILHECALNKCKFIFLSSASVYGNPDALPICEAAETHPVSPYALHKLMCENACLYFHENYNMDIKILRIFSAYGEGLKKQIFWDMFNKVQITGKLCMFGTGNESRDYINIKDLLQAVYLIVQNAPYEEVIYNVANGEEITIRQVAEEFADIINLPKENIHFSGENKEGNPINWKADISKLQRLGYCKSVKLKDGISSYLNWLRKSI